MKVVNTARPEHYCTMRGIVSETPIIYARAMRAFNRDEIQLSSYEIMLVQSSFARIIPQAEIVLERFYSALVELDPALASLFPKMLGPHGLKFTHTVSLAIDHIGNVSALQAMLQALGQRHARFGIQPMNYATTNAALQRTLKEELEDEFTNEMSLAWAKAFWSLAHIMQEAADVERQLMYGPTVN